MLGIGSIFTRVSIADIGTAIANMFVPIDLLKPILSDLKTYGRPRQPSKPCLGVNSEESHGHVFITRILQGGSRRKK